MARAVRRGIRWAEAVAASYQTARAVQRTRSAAEQTLSAEAAALAAAGPEGIAHMEAAAAVAA